MLYKSFLARKHHSTSFTGPPTCWKRLHRTFSAHTQPGTSFTAPPHGWKSLYRSFLALKHACTSFKRPPRWLKRLHRIFSALTQAGTSFTASTQGWKPLYRFVLALKHGCTSFTGLPMRWKCVYWSLSTLKQAFTNVTTPSHGWKRLKDLSWYSNMPAQASNQRTDFLKDLLGMKTGLDELHNTYTRVKTALHDLSCHWNMDAQASLDFQCSENEFIRLSRHIHSLARTSQHLRMGEKAFTDLSWLWNMPAKDLNYRQDGWNGFIGYFLH